ncbi:MAG: hypothetical protein JWO46_2789 [Nocardioidaceae bacterium]|nr:hypothetical protein [Nocardioidaceae bacterium]
MRRRRSWLVVGVAAVVVAAGAGTAYARSQGESPGSYRTVLARTGTVEQTLSTTGTVDSADRANVTAGVAGTVATVAAAPGDTVKAGDVLLRLDTTDLQAALDQATAQLASARAQLETDQDAQSSTVSSATTSTPKTQVPKGQTPQGQTPQGQTPSGGTTTPVQTQAVKDALAALKAQQDAVTQAQSDATAALKDASDALADQVAACGSAYQPGTDPGTSADPSADSACQTALATVQDKQQAADAAQQKLADALSALSTTLNDAIAKLDAATMTGAGGGARAVASSVVVVTADQPGGSQTVTAATLAKDQAAIDTARADVLEAQQALTAAVITAPIAGRVGQLDLTKGDAVSAGDISAVITKGSALLVTSNVGETTIRSVAVGQQVRVSTPGSTTTSTGQVTSIGLTADTSGGSATYPVTIAVPQPTVTLPVGSSVLVDIVLATAKDAVTVPTSAISTIGTRTLVRVLKDGVQTATVVTLGAVGDRRVAVTKGLTAGTRVVLADLDASVTGASTTLTNRVGFPGGGQGRFNVSNRSGGAPAGGPPG